MNKTLGTLGGPNSDHPNCCDVALGSLPRTPCEAKCAAAARTRQRRSNRIASILARVRRYVLLGPLLPPVRHDVDDERDADDWRIVETAGAESQSGPAAGAAAPEPVAKTRSGINVL